jgi:hypothetical protein
MRRRWFLKVPVMRCPLQAKRTPRVYIQSRGAAACANNLYKHNLGGCDGAARQSRSGSPSPLRSPVACLLRAYGTRVS